METFRLWDDFKSTHPDSFEPFLEYYPAENRKSDASVIVFPGGAYIARVYHEGGGYALFLNSIGIDAFVCQYRVFPDRFPDELSDARRAVRTVRRLAPSLGLDPGKVAVMGSSAGGHLAALVSTYEGELDTDGIDETGKLPYRPDATILCYPVIHMPDETMVAHRESFEFLMGEDRDYAKVSPDLLVNGNTPKAFIFHTSTDPGVDVRNSYLYASALRAHGIPHEIHVFGLGGHGVGLSGDRPYIGQWTVLLRRWFVFNGWLPEDATEGGVRT